MSHIYLELKTGNLSTTESTIIYGFFENDGSLIIPKNDINLLFLKFIETYLISDDRVVNGELITDKYGKWKIFPEFFEVHNVKGIFELYQWFLLYPEKETL